MGSLNRMSMSATLHCLTGCGIGELLGLIISSILGWGVVASIALAVSLAFVFGYSLTLKSLLGSGLALASALPLALASDTLSITVMEVVDNAIIFAIPGAASGGPLSLIFWGAFAVAMAGAFVAAFPVNCFLIARGRGHALVHDQHGQH